MSYSEDTIDFLHKGDLIGMNHALSKAISEDSPELLSDLAEYLQMMGFIDESRKVYDKLLENSAENSDALINLAEIAEADGDLDKALGYLYQISEADENYVPALVKIADIYQSDGDFETAMSKLELARTISDNPLVAFAIAESKYAQEDYQGAIQEYAKLSAATIFKETKISIYQRIGDSYARLGNFEQAIPFLEKSLEQDKSAESYFEIAVLQAEIGETERALRTFEKIHDEFDTEFLDYELAYAQTLNADGQVERALEVASDALSKNPNNPMLLHFLARLHYQQKENSQAERYLMQALDLPDLHDETVFLLANLYYNEEDYEAVLTLTDLLEEEQPLASWLFAQSYAALEQDSEAAAIYQELMSTSLTENPDFFQDYLHFLRETGQADKANALAEQYQLDSDF